MEGMNVLPRKTRAAIISVSTKSLVDKEHVNLFRFGNMICKNGQV